MNKIVLIIWQTHRTFLNMHDQQYLQEYHFCISTSKCYCHTVSIYKYLYTHTLVMLSKKITPFCY